MRELCPGWLHVMLMLLSTCLFALSRQSQVLSNAFVYDSRCVYCCHNKMEFFPYRPILNIPSTHQMTHITVLVLVEVGDSVSRPYLDCRLTYKVQYNTSLLRPTPLPHCAETSPVSFLRKDIVSLSASTCFLFFFEWAPRYFSRSRRRKHLLSQLNLLSRLPVPTKFSSFWSSVLHSVSSAQQKASRSCPPSVHHSRLPAAISSGCYKR